MYCQICYIKLENTHHQVKYKCMAELQLDWFGFDQTRIYVSNSTKAAESPKNKEEVSCTVILPLKLSG